jgi:MFS superfamily sulfate permease-like transporter
VLGLIDVGELRRYWAWRRTDFVIAIAAMIGVLLTTVLAGMVLAVMLSVAFVLYRASRPYVAALGRMPGYRATFADMARHEDAEPVPGLVIVRLDAPLYFFNANVAKTQILELVAARRPEPQGVLIDLAATADLDVTTADMLRELHADLRARSIEVLLAQVKGPVRDRMRKTGLMAEMGEDRVYMSIGSAVTDFGRRWPPETQAPAEGERSPESSSEPEQGVEPDSFPGRAPGP